MPHPIFSDLWAKACARELNARKSYRQAAARWEGAILLLMHADPSAGLGEDRRVFLDLWHGECRDARAAAPADEDLAKYVLSGSVASWTQVITGRVAPLMALLTGKLRVTKGNLAELVPHATAARELIAAVGALETEFPGASP